MKSLENGFIVLCIFGAAIAALWLVGTILDWLTERKLLPTVTEKSSSKVSYTVIAIVGVGILYAANVFSDDSPTSTGTADGCSGSMRC